VISSSSDPFQVFGRRDGKPYQEALLGRRERDVLTRTEGRAFEGQRVLITGGAGFVGAALARRILKFKPAQLTLMDQSDSGLVRLEMDLHSPARLNLVLGDVSRISDVRNTIRDARPDVVFHAAAASRNALAERAVCATVRTNVFGTLHVARESAAAGARLVVISTRDTESAATLMGATRRVGELVSVCPSAPGFRPTIVRLGHLLDLPAGLVDGWLDQLRTGRPLLVPEGAGPAALITGREAVSLILKADLLGSAGQVFRLDSGDATEPAEIARRLLAWASAHGLEPVPLHASPLQEPRPSMARACDLVFTPAAGHPRIQYATQRTPDTRMMNRILRALREDLRRRDAFTAMADLRAAVPGYLPSTVAREEAASVTLQTAMGMTWRPLQPLSA
jgi:nucleoside-diphosphate-sugar epimerase